ncbi:MAG TPA: shikimate kinase [Clostridia bacterium]|nr:shikimate kinase [Clostridia bacterium]
MKTNIVLIGFMGVGKTSVGRRVAEILNKEFIDTDQEIERITGLPIMEIFNKYGEIRFRSEEKLVIAKLSNKTNCVISTGGGAILDGGNVEALKRHGVLICLKASPEKIQTRVKKRGGRPLLQRNKSVEYIQELLDEREQYYATHADHVMDTTNLNIQETVEEILALVKGRDRENANSCGQC